MAKPLLNLQHQSLSDCAAVGRLIQHCSDHRLLRQAKQLHTHLILFSVTPNNYLASKLITFYSKTNHTKLARKLFDQIPQPNTFSFNAMLIGYSLNNLHSNTLDLFSHFTDRFYGNVGVRPDHFTITCVLKALSGVFLGDGRLGKEVHCYAMRNGFDSDVYVVNALVTFYSRCGEMGLARSVFDGICNKDVVSWNSMIAGYSQNGYYEECKNVYREMLRLNGFRPDKMTVVSVLQACLQSKDLILGMEVHKYVLENKVEMDISVCNAVIGLYAKCGSLDYARELFDEVSEKDEVTYSSIVSGYMAHGFVDKAMDIFRKMKTPGLNTWNAVLSGMVQNNSDEIIPELIHEMILSGLKPNTVTLSSILPTISYFSNLRVGKEMHAYAIKNSYDRNIYVATAIIDTYSKSGYLHGAQRVFDQSKDRSVIIWTSIISAYASHGDANMSLSLFNEMLKKGTQPDSITFTSVLSACGHTGMVDEAWKIFNSMLPKYNIHPSVEHYACLVGVLSRAKRLEEAVQFVSKMPIEPSAKVWGALLNGASVTGNVEIGKYACDHLFEIEPECTGNYIIMANLYSQAERWEEAEKVRGKMNKSGLVKIPGSSWIEVNGGVHNFIAKDFSNERTEEIYGILEQLLELMIDEGYALQHELDDESVHG